MYPYYITLITFCSLLITFNLNSALAQCPLLDSKDFLEYYQGKENRSSYIMLGDKRFSKYKQKSKIDSLFKFAVSYFEERLPKETICVQIDMAERYWSFFSGSKINMAFTFFLDHRRSDRHDEIVGARFVYNPDSDKQSVRISPRNLWIPNCLMYPDSCQFQVTSMEESIQIAKDIGFVDNQYTSKYLGSKKAPPFHFEVPKKLAEECMMQSLFVSMHTGATMLSSKYKMERCFTLKDRIDVSDLVVDGTVLNTKKIELNGIKHIEREMEVHYLFKGELTSEKIKVLEQDIVVGHTIGCPPSYQVRLEAKKRYIFLLRFPNEHEKKLELSSASPQSSPVYWRVNNAWELPTNLLNRNPHKPRRTAIALYEQIETATGIKRKKVIIPQVTNKVLLKETNTIPNRENGLASFLKIEASSSAKNSVELRIYLAGTNDYQYLNNWEMELSYDSSAFGSWLAREGKIEILDHLSIVKEIFSHYDVTVADENANTLKLIWERKPESENYFEFIPLNNERFLGTPVLSLQLPVADINQAMNLQIRFAKNPIAQDMDADKVYEVEYQSTPNIVQETMLAYKQPVIKDFYPKMASIGDTVTIEGKYFEKAAPFLLGKGIEVNHRFFKPVPSNNIIFESDEKIVFTVPTSMKGTPEVNRSFYCSDYYEYTDDQFTYQPITNNILLFKSTTADGMETEEVLIIE